MDLLVSQWHVAWAQNGKVRNVVDAGFIEVEDLLTYCESAILAAPRSTSTPIVQ